MEQGFWIRLYSAQGDEIARGFEKAQKSIGILISGWAESGGFRGGETITIIKGQKDSPPKPARKGL